MSNHRPPRGDGEERRLVDTRDLVAAAREEIEAVPPAAERPTILDRAPRFTAPPPDSFTGYRILREVHRGGQGVVYQALQQSTGRTVAIKVMREGPFAGAADRARFDREVRVLGQLDHPNTVTIRERGDAAGSAYFVMDYVAGPTLDVHVASRARPVSEIVELFAAVCDAVQAAHLRGIIHRDLKPSNIRVDASGAPHVLDFGLAKVTPVAGEAAKMTVTGQFLGSLPWASPEQAEGVPGRVDVRTDVYSLGVMLYQMLTGRFPYEVTGPMRDVLDRIVTVEAPRPGTVRRGIDDEVDTIVARCLAKDRERRYQSAGELGRDLRRYLRGEPIEAKRDSLAYLLRKQLGRYRVPVALAAAFALLVAVGFVASFALWQRAEEAAALARLEQQDAELAREAEVRQRAVAEAERDRAAQAEAVAETARLAAEADRARAAATTSFLAQVLALGDPQVAGRPDVTVRALLDHAAASAGASLLEQPDAEAIVRATIGQAYYAMGESGLAREQLVRALDLLDGAGAGAPDPMLRYEVLRALAGIELEDPRMSSATAEGWGVRLVDTGLGIIGSGHPELTRALGGVLLRIETGQLAGMDANLAALLERTDAELAPDDPLRLLVADSIMAAGWGLKFAHGDPAAGAFFRASLEMRRALLPPGHPDLARGVNLLAAELIRQGRPEKAEELLRESIDVLERTLPGVTWLRGSTVGQLGECLVVQGRYGEAERVLLESHAPIVEALGAAHWVSTDSLKRIIELYETWGRAEPERARRDELAGICAGAETLPDWRRTARHAFGSAHRKVRGAMNELESLPRRVGDPAARRAEAESLLDRLDAARADPAGGGARERIVSRQLEAWSSAWAPWRSEALRRRMAPG